jgi:hypothetical protein
MMNDTDNASILSNACAALDRYRSDERAIELEMAILQARLDAVREFVAALSGKPRARRGRPPRQPEPVNEDAIGAFADAVA